MHYTNEFSPPASLFPYGKEPRIGEVTFVDYRYLRLPRVMHKHDDRSEILYVVSGSATHVINGKTYQIEPQDLVVYNAGVLHDEYIDATEDMKVYCIAIHDLHLPDLAPNRLLSDDREPVIKTGKNAAMVEDLCSHIFAMTATGSQEANRIAHYLMLALVSFVQFQPVEHLESRDKEAASAGRQIKKWLDRHYTEEVSLQKISEDLFLSPFYISRAFKSYSGYSPIQYVTRRRIGEAQSLLRETDHSILDIAFKVGYNSNSLFTRTFNNLVGCSPLEYRNSTKETE